MEVEFENRAWENAEHPRLVSKPVKLGEAEYIFEIGYHYVKRMYMLEVEETRNWGRGYPETYGSVMFFDSIEEAKDYVTEFLKGLRR